MIRFTTKTDTTPAEDAAPKKAVKAVEPVQLSLDPDASEEETSAKPARKRGSFRSK
jgi:hypothetical protein